MLGDNNQNQPNNPSPPPNNYTPPANQMSEPQLPFMWFVTTADNILEFENTLRGQVRVIKDGQEDWVKKGQALANDMGIQYLTSFAQTHTGKNAHLSYLEPEQITDICRKTHFLLLEVVLVQGAHFGIAKENYDLVVATTMNFIFFSLQRALYGGEREFIEHTFHQQVQHNYNDNTGGRMPNAGGYTAPAQQPAQRKRILGLF